MRRNARGSSKNLAFRRSALDNRDRPALIWVMHENKDATLARLKRLEGQVRGGARMVEEDRYCVDILTQVAAVRAALKGVEKLVIEDRASHCIENAVASGNKAEQRAKFLELIQLLDRARH